MRVPPLDVASCLFSQIPLNCVCVNMESGKGKDNNPANVSKLSKLCEILHDIEASTSHLSRGVDYAKRLANSGPVLMEVWLHIFTGNFRASPAVC